MPQVRGVTSEEISTATPVISALDSPLRMKILALLSERDHVVHELVSKLEKSQPLVSQHLRVLKRTGLVSSDRIGREVVYRLSTPEAIDLIRHAVRVARSLSQEGVEIDMLAERRARNDELKQPVQVNSGASIGAAAIAAVPDETAPEVDPGLAPQTPSPVK